MNRLHLAWCGLLALSLVLMAAATAAQTPPQAPTVTPTPTLTPNGDDTVAWSNEAAETLKSIGSMTESWLGTPPDEAAMVKVQEEIAAIRIRAEKCIADYTARLESTKEKLAALGGPGESAAPDIRDTRQQFEDEQQAIDRQLAVCRLLTLGVRDIRDRTNQLRREMLSRELLNREAPLWAVVSDVIVNGFAPRTDKKLAFEPWPASAVGVLLLAMLVPMAVAFAARLCQRFAVADPDRPLLRRAVLARMYSRRAPWLAGIAAVIVTLHIGGATPLAAIGAALLLSMLLAPLTHLLVCQGQLHCADGVPARLLVDLVLVAAALLLVDAGDYLPAAATVLLRAAYLLLLALVALWLLNSLSRRSDLETLRSLRIPIALTLLAGPIVDWIGYHNLGAFLTLGVYGSGAGMLLIWLLLSAIGHVSEQLRDTESDEQPGLRQWLGYARGERVPGLSLLVWLIRIGALVGLGYWLLTVWQVSETDTAAFREFMRDGFEVGAIRIVPSKLLLAIFAFLLLLALARWLRRQLGERWLTRTSLDSGARQSIVSLTSYTIVGLAIMLALSMAGVDFQNLAIVAGALSVGIGFGLQNIVNNFVSGLILLFERPVRPGDWVIVGDTEGYVRRISIRYTLIQTFDRAEVLVPNSELISNQVTNLMLSDAFGRVRIAVGVAYGSDTHLVRDILQRVARAHPMAVTHDPRVPAPIVYFMGFGDSSLDFELRFFIQNIDYKLTVSSDIRFAIDDAFREAGIEIPFPQRVVHRAAASPTVPGDAGDDLPGGAA